MRSPTDLHNYQKSAVNFQCTRPHSALWLDPGLGKTAVTLTSAAHLIQTGFLKAVLVVAPIRVCRLVWRQEAAKWAHTKHLRFTLLLGNRDQRTRALMREADIYVVNYDNLGWIAETLQTYYVAKGKPLPFDGLVWDELSMMKNSSTNRVKAVRKVLPYFKWRTGLTGSPASNGYKDLHGQFLVLDEGQRLGTSKDKFLKQWYRHDAHNAHKLIPYRDTDDQIKHLIGDITLEMSEKDYLELPDLVVNDVWVDLPPELRAKYDQLEKDFFLALDSGQDIELFNQASLTNKLLQFASGAVYPVAGMPLWEPIHDLKLDALEELLEESAGEPLLVSYDFRFTAERIMSRFKKYDPINLTECKSQASLDLAIYRWKSGQCPLMVGHPRSMGHGVDQLQERGNTLVWMGCTWSLDLYKQFNARLRRQGMNRNKPVICNRILMKDTMDVAQSMRLEEKDQTEKGLRNAIKEYRKSKNA